MQSPLQSACVMCQQMQTTGTASKRTSGAHLDRGRLSEFAPTCTCTPQTAKDSGLAGRASPCGCANNATGRLVATTEYKLLKLCQQMVDSASRMECARCGAFMSTTGFYQHVYNGRDCLGTQDSIASPRMNSTTSSAACPLVTQRTAPHHNVHVSCMGLPAATEEFTLCLEDEDVSVINFAHEGATCSCRRSTEPRNVAKKHPDSTLCPVHRNFAPLDHSIAQQQIQRKPCSRHRAMQSCQSSGNLMNQTAGCGHLFSGPTSPAQQYLSASVMHDLRGVRGKPNVPTGSVNKFHPSSMLLRYHADTSVQLRPEEQVRQRKEAALQQRHEASRLLDAALAQSSGKQHKPKALSARERSSAQLQLEQLLVDLQQ